jgi:hypothetical protein
VATVDDVIDQALEQVLRRLAQLTVAEPAYAVGLAASPGNESLAVEVVAVAIDRDRSKWVGQVDPGEAVFQSWNPYEFSIQERLGPWERTSEAFAAAEAEAHAELIERGIEDPQRYVYKRVAAKLDPARLEFPVTEDFIAFVFDGPDHLETAENIRFSAPPRALAILKSKNLLMA